MTKKRAKTITKRSHAKRWSSLTWADLNNWAGSGAVTRGRTYQRQGCVLELGMSLEGELVAWVTGTSRYATRVRCEHQGKGGSGPNRLKSSCSCPVVDRCKHAVAVIVAALEFLELGEEIRQAETDDTRWEIAKLIFGASAFETASEPSSLEPYLGSLKKAQLVKLLLEFSAIHPEVKANLGHRRALLSDDVATIVQQIRAEIATVSAQEVSSNGWSGTDTIPDYSRVVSGLTNLLDNGHHDAVIELGGELFEAGQDQVGRSHDDGETGMEIVECMAVVFQAVLKCSLSDSEKIMYAIDFSLADDYGLDSGIDHILNRKWSKRAWSTVADTLAKRLDSDGASVGTDSHDHRNRNSLQGRERHQTRHDRHDRYVRDRLSNWVIYALDAAGREEEVIKICKKEAVRTGSYPRLVSKLMGAKQLDEATEWAARGYVAVLDESPSTASSLRRLLRDIACRRRRWPLVAAYDAELFFGRPELSKLMELLASAKKANCESDVRKAALRFMETGKRPAPSGKWPLPSTQLPGDGPPTGRTSEPVKFWNVLRDFAINEGRPDDVLSWHDRLESRTRSRFRHSDDASLRVAMAVSRTHPERAIVLYHEAALDLIDRADPKAYVQAGNLLQRVRDLLHTSKRSSEWPGMISEVRESHRRKRRLMEVLDGVEGQPIVRAKQAGRARRRQT